VIAAATSTTAIATQSPIPAGEGASTAALTLADKTASVHQPRQVGATRRSLTRLRTISTERGDPTDEGDIPERLVDDVRRLNAIERCLRRQHKSMGQGRPGHYLDIVWRHEVASSADSKSFCRAHNGQPGPRRSSDGHALMVSGRLQQGEYIISQSRCDMSPPCCCPKLGEAMPPDRRQIVHEAGTVAVDKKLTLEVVVWIAQREPKEKPVSLALRNLHRAGVIEWVLGGDDGERAWKSIGGSIHGDLALAHRLEKG
jgi:hypothetical protein